MVIHFNPRSPNGLRLVSVPVPSLCKQISIHAARMGCDNEKAKSAPLPHHFNPRSPNGLRQGKFMQNETNANFNPRSPNGLRHIQANSIIAQHLFQSTQPEWAATQPSLLITPICCNFNPRSPNGLRPQGKQIVADIHAVISIHAARMGCDFARGLGLI